MEANGNGLQPNCDGLHPSSDGLQPHHFVLLHGLSLTLTSEHRLKVPAKKAVLTAGSRASHNLCTHLIAHFEHFLCFGSPRY